MFLLSILVSLILFFLRKTSILFVLRKTSGNTCYLNSVVQCLRAVPELQTSLEVYRPNTNSHNSQQGRTIFVNTLRDTYKQLGRQETAYQPMTLVQAVKLAFPQFAQLSPQGHPMQQDAEEFYSGLMSLVASETQTPENMKAALPGVENFGGATNTIDALFAMKLRETLTCDEFSEGDANAEPPVVSHDLHRKLVCNIQGGSDAASQVNINHVQEGIALGLTGKIEKRSEILGRDAVWTRTQRIERLAPFITVQFGRFYWKATPDSQDHAGVKCKVMKPVAFSSTLDVYDFCTPEVQKTLQTARKKALAAEEDRINKKLKGQIEGEDDKMDTDEKEEENDEDLQAALAMSMGEEEGDTFVGPGLPKDFQGYYELFAVVTHKGRDADGGHYMAWVKADTQGDVQKIADTDEDNEDWFVFDDDEVSPCKTEDVLKLKGGGDWHMSYLNFYRAKK